VSNEEVFVFHLTSMKNKIASLACMTAWTLLVVLLSAWFSVPRWRWRLTTPDLVVLVLMPAGAFLSALPGVSPRWFAYSAVLYAAFYMRLHAHHIFGISPSWGLDDGVLIYVVPLMLAAALAVACASAAWLRPRIAG